MDVPSTGKLVLGEVPLALDPPPIGIPPEGEGGGSECRWVAVEAAVDREGRMEMLSWEVLLLLLCTVEPPGRSGGDVGDREVGWACEPWWEREWCSGWALS